jgi:hypothetical protein
MSWSAYCSGDNLECKFFFSWLLRPVVWRLETTVSETILPPSSGLNLVIKEMYTLHCCQLYLFATDVYLNLTVIQPAECLFAKLSSRTLIVQPDSTHGGTRIACTFCLENLVGEEDRMKHSRG